MVRYSTEHVSAFDSTYLVSSVTSAFEAWLKLTAQRLREVLKFEQIHPVIPDPWKTASPQKQSSRSQLVKLRLINHTVTP